MTASSSASTVPAPAQSSSATRYSRTEPQDSSSRRRASSCTPSRPASIGADRVAERHREHVGERVGRIGRADHRAQPQPAGAHRGRGRDGRLADAALAGEEEDPHEAREATPTLRQRARRDSDVAALDRLLQLLERGAHDHAGGAALDQAGQRDRDVDRELVVHAGRVVLGLEPVRTVEPAQPFALDERPRERGRAARSSRTRACSGSSCRGRRRGTPPSRPDLRRRARGSSPASRRAPTPGTARSRARPRGTARADASIRIRSLACSATRPPRWSLGLRTSCPLRPALRSLRARRAEGSDLGLEAGPGPYVPWRAPQSPMSPTGSIGTRTPNGSADAVTAVITRQTPNDAEQVEPDRASAPSPSSRNRFPTTMSSPRALRATATANAQTQTTSDTANSTSAMTTATGSSASATTARERASPRTPTFPIHELRMIAWPGHTQERKPRAQPTSNGGGPDEVAGRERRERSRPGRRRSTSTAHVRAAAPRRSAQRRVRRAAARASGRAP